MPAEDFNAFLLAVFASCRTAIEPNAGMYVCHASSVQREFQTAIEAAGFEVRTSSTSPSSIATWTGRPMRVRRQISIDLVGSKQARRQPAAPDHEAGGAR